MLSDERQQIKDVLDLIVEGGRFQQFDKVGSAVEPQRIANKMKSFGVLIDISYGMNGKQWHITDSGCVLHEFLKSEEIESAVLRRDNFLLCQWALLTSTARRKGLRDGELALLDIALGRSPASKEHSEDANRLLMRSGSPHTIEALRFLSGQTYQPLNSTAIRFDNFESELKRYSFSVSLNSQDREIFKRVRDDMESSGDYDSKELSNKGIVIIMAIAWLELRGI